MNNSNLTLSNLAGGALNERFSEELAKVIHNIEDPNTDATAKRKIVITVVLAPNATRDVVSAKFDTKSTLAPSYSIGTSMYVGHEGDKTVCFEIGKEVLPNQVVLDNTGNIANPPHITVNS